MLDRLDARRVVLEGLELVEGAFEPLFERHGCAIVRPDRYLFGVTNDRWDLDGRTAELARSLSLR